MKNVVLKAALITVGALAAAGILIFSLWMLIAPQSMATVSEKLGNYSFAVTCADLKYKYSDDSYDLARCAEDSILSGEDNLIVKYCESLVDKSDFDAVCRRRDEELLRTDVGGFLKTNYNTYIIGTLAAAQYRGGDLDKAIKTAERGEPECFAKLVIELVKKGSDEDIQKVLNTSLSLGTTEYVKGLIELLTK